jgi:hypothetical protein
VPTTPTGRSGKGSARAGRATAGGPLTAAGTPAAPVVAAATTAAAAAAATGATHADAPRTGSPHPAPAPVQAIVKTVTKIINVVPPLIRALIAALALLAIGLAVSSRVSAMRAKRLARQRSELLEDVGLLQAALLPTLPDRLGPVGTSAAYRPASGPAAGGDFFDVFALGDGQLGVIVGDVSGHGREALPHTTLVRFTLRAYLEAGLSPRGALQTAAPVLERQLGDSFATVVVATYHPRERTLVYACAGHPPPLVSGDDGPIVPITVAAAPPIGVGGTTGIRQTTISVPGEAIICFYTDGVVESRVHGELYGSARLERALAELGVTATATSLLDLVAGQVDQRPDDMAACLLHVEGGSAAPRVLREELEIDRGEAARDRAERFLLAGGLAPAESAEVIRTARNEVARHGRVVIDVRLDAGAPEVSVHPQNIALFQPPVRDASRARSASR